MRTDRGWKRFFATGWGVSALIGLAAFHQWQGRVRAVEERLTEAERTRKAIVERVAAEERLRIARELHDSLTHSISVVKVQSGVAVHLARKRGEDVPEALQAIEEAAGDAARELRETLGVLRQDAEPCPGYGVDNLEVLLARTKATGLAVEIDMAGQVRELPREVDTAAYRIVQEALTNVSRHASATTVRVLVVYEPDQVVVRVEDDGVGRHGKQAATGLGLVGMRERATALGGHLVAQGRPSGGFTVQADLPTVARAGRVETS